MSDTQVVAPTVKSRVKINEDGSWYKGDLLNDIPHGYGKYYWNSKEFYKGNFFHKILPNIGDWMNGKFNGHGLKKLADGTKYEGNWTNGRPNGQGSSTYPDGSTYTGNWVMGEATGSGTKIYPDGSTCEGMFFRGKPNGKGIKFGGSWKENMSSFSQSEYVDKSQFKRLKSISYDSSLNKNTSEAFQYQGDWKDEMFHGQGILTFGNKD